MSVIFNSRNDTICSQVHKYMDIDTIFMSVHHCNGFEINQDAF